MSLKFLAIVWLISSKHVKTSDSFIFGGQIECDDPNLRMLSFFWRETVGGNVGDSLIRCEGKSVDFYIIKRTLHRNVTKATAQFIKTHQEKLKNLSRSTSLQQTYSSADITWRNSGKSKECMMICTIRTGIVNYICSRVLRISELFRCRERSQTVRCCLEWLGRLKCQLDASLSFFSTVAKVFSESVT